MHTHLTDAEIALLVGAVAHLITSLSMFIRSRAKIKDHERRLNRMENGGGDAKIDARLRRYQLIPKDEEIGQ
jgi:hypothetical protein